MQIDMGQMINNGLNIDRETTYLFSLFFSAW